MFKAYKMKHPKIFWSITILTILLPSIILALFFFVKDEYSRTFISDIVSPVIDLLAMSALVFAATHSRRISNRLALGWGMLALALFSFALGDITWAIIELYQNNTPFPSIADGFYLLFYPIFFAGVLILPSTRLSSTEWIKRIIDLSIVLISATLGLWIFVIGPIIGTEFTSLSLEIVLTAAYPVGDLILFFAVLIIIYNMSKINNIGTILLLTLGLIAMIVTDIIFSYQSTLGKYVSGGVLDLGWILSNFLIAFAGIHQGIASQTYKVDNLLSNKQPTKIKNRISQILTYLPYIWVAGAFYLLYSNHNLEGIINSDLLFFGVGLIIGLVIIRQIITLNENYHLLLNLMNAVDQGKLHVSELNKANLNLQQEIIQRIKVEKQLSYDALHDGLTGLANRVLFMDRLEHAVEITKRESEFRYSILFLDIDNFKSINDGLGHSYGDQALIEIAKRLTGCTRSIDTVARFGGDEFIILLEHTLGTNTAKTVADRLIAELRRPFYFNRKEIFVTCSIGIVLDISEYNNSEEILRDVDIALYRVKEKGKNQYEIFDLEMRKFAMSRLELEGDLRYSISNGELLLVYQPIFSLEHNLVEGVEALIRWRHPLRGLVMPSEFISFAEESGFIIQIGDWVLHEACSQLKKWHTEYPNLEYLTVNVNISGKQIKQKDFVDKVKNTLLLTSLNPKRLILEITESTIIENQSIIDELLSELREIGVAFAIDDFGTGYSSLGYLKNFSVDTIKIDKTFIDGIVEDKKGFEIVKTIIQMANEMGIKTVAEGIENSEQLKYLRSLMCKLGQGYLFSKPVDAVQIDKILKNTSNED
jgi:diguanylate cyclase (GGDEF)-like protein